MPASRPTSHPILILALALLTAPAPAATTWTRAAGTSNWDTNANWSAAQPSLAVDALFPSPVPASVGQIFISAPEQAASLSFTGSYYLDGGSAPTASLTLGAAGGPVSVTGVGNASATLDLTLAGSVGLTKNNGGLLHLNRANTFTGPVTINGGTLSIAADNRLGAPANPITLNGGTLRVRNTFSTGRTMTFDVFGGTVSVDAGATFSLASGLAANPNPITKTGFGTWTLNVHSSRTASTIVDAGAVRLNAPTALGSGPVFLKTGGSLEVPHATAVQNHAILQSGGGIRGGGGGAGVFGNYAGTISVNNDAGFVFLSGGDNPTDTLRIGLANGNTYTGGARTTTVVNGAGRLVMCFGNDYAGDWQIDSGTLTYFNALALGTGTSPVVVNAGTFELQSTFARAIRLNDKSTLALFPLATSTAPVTVAPNAAATIKLETGSSPEYPIHLGDAPNGLTGGAGATLTVTGAANAPAGRPTLHLRHANDYAGNWSISRFANVRVTHPNALGTGTTPVALTNGATPNGGTLELANLTLARPVNITGGSTLRGTGNAAVSAPVALFGFGSATLDTPAPADTLALTDSLTTFGGALTKTGPGTLRITGPQSHAAGSRIVVTAGTLDLFSPAGTPTARTLSVNVEAGTLNMNQTQHLHDLRVDGRATLNAPTPGSAVLHVDTLTIAGGTLDLTTNKLIVVNGDLIGVTLGVYFGHSSGDWNGPGIVTSAATANTGLGISRADDAGLTGGTFAGVPVAASDVLVAHTLLGDANLDAAVDFSDLVRLAQNYNTTGKAWWQGDFTYDNAVDFNDLVKLAQNYNATLPLTPIPGAGTAFESDLRIALAHLPEPTTLPATALAFLALTRRTKRTPVSRASRPC